MDRPTSRRAAIGRALNAREPVSTDAFLSLTEEERVRGITLFSDEPATPGGQHDTFEQGPAPVAPMVPTARMFKHVRPADAPDAAILTAWQARVLGAMLTAAVVGFAVVSVRLVYTPSTSRVTVPVAAAPKSVTVAAASPTAVTPTAVSPAAVAPNEVIPAVVPDETPAPPAPARMALLTAREPEPQPARAEPPIRAAVVSSAIVAEPRPAVDTPIAPSPVAAVPAAPPPRVEASASAAPVPVRVPAPEAAIQTVLSRYRAAYQELDAAAARAVWPSADTKALRRAFDRLEAQELVFDSCAVSVSDARAVAVCSGTASYVPRVGKKARRGDQRQWEFELSRADDGWLIDTVSAR